MESIISHKKVLFYEAKSHCRHKLILDLFLKQLDLESFKNKSFEEIFLEIKKFKQEKVRKGSIGNLTIYDIASDISRYYGNIIEKVYIIGSGPKRAIKLLDIKKHFDKVLYGNSSAKSCLEMALLDLHTQEAGIPLWQFLRIRLGNKIKDEPHPLSLLRMLGGSFDKEVADAKKFHDEGYRHWKIKVGLLSLNADLDRIEFLCNLLKGDTVSVDANGAFGLEDAISFCTSEKTKELTFAEQLISPDSPMQDFMMLKSKSKLPIGLDESIHGKKELERFVAAGSMDGASLKLIKTGGLLEALTCASFLESNNLKLNLACKVAETSIGAAATAALGFALDKLEWGFSMSNQYLEFDVCERALRGQNGSLFHHQLGQHGIGVVPDPYRLQQFLAKSYSPIAC